MSDTARDSVVRDTVILGSGCAGLTAAIYTARANLRPLVLEGHEPGGQLSITTLVENFPGWPEGIQGPELIENMKRQAARFGAEYESHLVSVDLSKRPFTSNLGQRRSHADPDYCQRGVGTLAGTSAGTGADWARRRARARPAMASSSGGREIAVIGGGDSAMEEALFLTRFASKVTLIHRRESFRASKIMLERAIAHPKIEFLTNTAVEEVLGVEEKEVKGLRLRDVTTGDDCWPVSGMFLGIGHEPNAKMFAGQMDLDEDGYIKTTDNVFHDNGVPGCFACGDVQDRRYRQAITAAGYRMHGGA